MESGLALAMVLADCFACTSKRHKRLLHLQLLRLEQLLLFLAVYSIFVSLFLGKNVMRI